MATPRRAASGLAPCLQLIDLVELSGVDARAASTAGADFHAGALATAFHRADVDARSIRASGDQRVAHGHGPAAGQYAHAGRRARHDADRLTGVRLREFGQAACAGWRQIFGAGTEGTV